jgi:hypothetical protein
MPTKAPVSDIARTLQKLRMKTTLSVTAMARELGMKPTRYQHYEYRYKKPHLPRDFVEKVTVVLRKHGVSEEDIAVLGVGIGAYVGDFQTLIEEIRQLRKEVAQLKRPKD